MAEYIEKGAIMSLIENEGRMWGEDYGYLDALGDIEDFPAADVVPRQLYEQACAVRDIAVEQLRQIGKDVGDSMEDVVEEGEIEQEHTNEK